MSVEAVNLAQCSQSSWSNGSSIDWTEDRQVDRDRESDRFNKVTTVQHKTVDGN